MGAPKDPEKRKLWIERKSGKNNPMYGKKRPDVSERMKGNKLGCGGTSMLGKKNPALAERNRQQIGEKNPMYGKKRPDLVEWWKQHTGEKNPMFGRTGEKHWNWKNGITPLHLRIRDCFFYRQWRSDVFTRDKFTCQECGDFRGGNLNAHHIKSFNNILILNDVKTYEQAMACEELWNINNGITLCDKCHRKIHKQGILSQDRPS